jgi:hypothetical protein
MRKKVTSSIGFELKRTNDGNEDKKRREQKMREKVYFGFISYSNKEIGWFGESYFSRCMRGIMEGGPK